VLFKRFLKWPISIYVQLPKAKLPEPTYDVEPPGLVSRLESQSIRALRKVMPQSSSQEEIKLQTVPRLAWPWNTFGRRVHRI